MKKPLYFVFFLLFFIGSFLGGVQYGRNQPAKQDSGKEERRILYYVDPMNPSHTSDKPGKAPCGMDMEPVYEDGQGAAASDNIHPGAVRISPEKQQMIGVRIGKAEVTLPSRTFRTLGRVAADENRTYSIVVPVEGWAKQVFESTTGTIVQKDQLMATYFNLEFYNKQRQYLYALRLTQRDRGSMQMQQGPTLQQEGPPQYAAQNPLPSGGATSAEAALRDPVQLARIELQLMGVGEPQLETITRTREYSEGVEVKAPVSGIVLSRGITPDQRFDKGTELFRIADLSRVWVLADVYESDAEYIRPGMAAKVILPRQKKSFDAEVSDVPPQFDSVTRTFKVRLEVENPESVLRPDMLADVEMIITHPSAVTVPIDAVLDSGLRKTVFVDLGLGHFEPRSVETGWRTQDRIEITKGLEPGEQIVVSGNFLIDSESRMKLAAAGMFGPPDTDPVCSTHVDPAKAKADGLTTEHGAKMYSFCSDQCKWAFEKNPDDYVGKQTGAGEHDQMAAVPEGEMPHGVFKCSVCGMYEQEAKAGARNLKRDYEGQTYYFCSQWCKRQFDKTPGQYTEKEGAGGARDIARGHEGKMQ